MKILVAAPEFPDPPHKGTALRNFHLLQALAARHTVRLLSVGRLTDAQVERAHALGWEAEGFATERRSNSSRLRDLVGSPAPDLSRRLRPIGLATRLRDLIAGGGWDALQVEGLELGDLIPVARSAGRPIRILYDAHNLEYRLQWRAAVTDSRRPARWPAALYSLIQSIKLRAYEARIGRLADDLIAVSEQDARGLRRLTGRPVTVVPNGIDCAAFQPAPSRVAVAGPRAPQLVFCATFDYRPNIDAAVWLVRAILPRVWSVRPDVRVLLVGRAPAPAVRALASDRVVVTGYVEDIRPWVAASDLYVVPLRAGGGTRFKVLEGLALGVPVLTTMLGAEGIGGQPNEHYLVADGAATFARAIMHVLDDSAGCRDLVKQGRRFVQARYDWSAVTPRLLDVYAREGRAEAARAR